MSDQTFGQCLVRASFNPSESNAVDVIKAAFAMLADDLNERRLSVSDNPGAARCFSLALTNLETACMYAVKGATA